MWNGISSADTIPYPVKPLSIASWMTNAIRSRTPSPEPQVWSDKHGYLPPPCLDMFEKLQSQVRLTAELPSMSTSPSCFKSDMIWETLKLGEAVQTLPSEGGRCSTRTPSPASLCSADVSSHEKRSALTHDHVLIGVPSRDSNFWANEANNSSVCSQLCDTVCIRSISCDSRISCDGNANPLPHMTIFELAPPTRNSTTASSPFMYSTHNHNALSCASGTVSQGSVALDGIGSPRSCFESKRGGQRHYVGRPRRSGPVLIAECLRQLDGEDPERIVCLKGIQKLGFSPGNALRNHFEQFGTVKFVLSTNPANVDHQDAFHGRRVRPSGMGYVVMEALEDAQCILTIGEINVNGVLVKVRNFASSDRASA